MFGKSSFLDLEPSAMIHAGSVSFLFFRQDFSAGGGWRVAGGGWRVKNINEIKYYNSLWCN